MFGYENSGLYMMIGMFFMGLGTSFIVVPVMPEILEALEQYNKKRGIIVDEHTLINNASGYFIFFQAIGETVGPTASSLIIKKLTFR